MNEYPGLIFTEDENRLIALIQSFSGCPTLDLEELRNLLAEAGYEQWQLSEEAMATLIEKYNSAVPEFELQIGERRDAEFSLEVSGDAMQAWVSFVPARGGNAIDPDAVYIELGDAGISFGIDPAAVPSLCAAREPGRVLVAAGLPPVNGCDTSFELLVADVRDRAPQINEQGLIDFREQGAIPTVDADQPLMRMTPATVGTPGKDVRGVVVEPLPGKSETFAANLIGAYVDKSDPNLLRAVFSGQPVHCANGVSVEHVFRVRNVNMATGNISFEGTVHVEGEVLPGMKVHATGDIVVGGVVDGAELDAGGDVRIGGGVIAKASVRAEGCVSARFAENSHVFAGTTIAIEDTSLQSDLQANNQIIVGTKSIKRGRLAGGSARAMMLIRAPLLGSSTCGVTKLLLGVNPVLEGKYQDLLHQIEKRREEEENLEKLVKHLAKQGDKSGLLERANASWQGAIKAWGQLLPERDELEKQLALVAGAKIEVLVGVDGAIDMTFGKKVLHSRQSHGKGIFSVEGDRVVFTQSDGDAMILD